MKIKLLMVFTVILLAAIGFGCGSMAPGTNGTDNGVSNTKANTNATVNAPTNAAKSTADQVIDNTVGKTTMGVPECDEVLDRIEAELKNPEDNVLVKAAKATVLNRIKDGVRESLEKNQRDTTRLARTCQEFRNQFDKFKAEHDAKKGQ
jgi:hypothetical protein